ncbi:MAG TPA: hypothetical protein VIM73_12160, partial [Polyangiaceae bacterium]
MTKASLGSRIEPFQPWATPVAEPLEYPAVEQGSGMIRRSFPVAREAEQEQPFLLVHRRSAPPEPFPLAMSASSHPLASPPQDLGGMTRYPDLDAASERPSYSFEDLAPESTPKPSRRRLVLSRVLFALLF